MYIPRKSSQLNLFTKEAPIMDILDKDDEIFKLAQAIDWDYIDEVYSKAFKSETTRGNPRAINSRVAFGALFIKQYLNITDRQTVQEIKRNPYWQAFLGFDTFTSNEPFPSSYMSTFRKRFPDDVMEMINMHHVKLAARAEDDSDDNKDDSDSTGSAAEDKPDQEQSPHQKPANEKHKGTLIIDATCCPADVAYPTDLKLLDTSRLWLERIIDHLYKEFGSLKNNGKKPRTYRKEARDKYHKFVKHPRQRKTKTTRKAIGEQLRYLKRDLGYINEYFDKHPEAAGVLLPVETRRLDTIRTVYTQQVEMYSQKKHQIENRVISLSQSWIRPIVRGKQKAKVEFGAKLSISVVNGYTFVDRLSFEAYNEGEHSEFVQVMEKYKERFGYYPEKVLADTIYGNRKNRNWCKEHGIYLSAEKLGRKPKNQSTDRKQRARDISDRNEVECKFGNLKRRFGMSLIKSKLAETSRTEIHMSIYVMNMLKIVQV